ncbi:major facilitator superfamily domain-containing protein 6-like [Stylophora pistillata]|uniref:Major facilitator superfamily domain-containing protein 6 n=1 Tax=Stylophora pistillata TaxID=50429 RepID=A0A2B4SFI5_STYPI|nr:major facilitator superfamily domain-containing protein 6-like [Stylophora pistillata]PFX27580.1 Major facilitator superfamily domain-containing protein 6 [Stylophora pistillata]
MIKEDKNNSNVRDNESKTTKSFEDWLGEELQVNRTLLCYKAFYFLFFAGFGASFPYMALYFKQIGLSASSVGILAGIRPIIQFISGPFWAILADRFKARKAVLLLSIFSWLIMTLALLIPTTHKTHCKAIKENTTEVELSVSRRKQLVQFGAQRENTASTSRVRDNVDNEKNNIRVNKQNGAKVLFHISPFQTYFLPSSHKEPDFEVGHPNPKIYELVYDQTEVYQVFIYLLMLVVVGEFLEAPTFIMTDAALLQKLGDERRHYGKTRLFGSLGFAFASLIVGGLLDSTEYRYCGRVMNDYRLLFYSFAIVMALAFVFAAWMFEFTYDEAENSEHGENIGSTKEILTLLLKFQYAFFITISFFLGFSNGLFFNFLNWYLEDLGASKSLMGIATVFRAIALIIAYIFNALLSEIFGHMRLFLFSVLGYFVLFGSFSVIHNPWWALPLEFLEGVTYGTAWSTAVTHLADATPQAGAATMQGILQGIYWGLGGGLGAIFGGVLIDKYGAVPSFRLGAVISASVLIVSGCIQARISQTKEEEPKSNRCVEHAVK